MTPASPALRRLGTIHEAKVCLVTDTQERELDRLGEIAERLDLILGLALSPSDRFLEWEPAPFGEAARDRRIVHAVSAYGDGGATSLAAGLRWDDP